MALTPQEVARLASLARLELTESECAELAPELEVILGSVARVGEVARLMTDAGLIAVQRRRIEILDQHSLSAYLEAAA